MTKLDELIAGAQWQQILVGLEPGLGAAVTRLAQSAYEAGMNEGAQRENQRYLDQINNFKPEPGQLTTASFGSAGAAMETQGWKNTFTDRINELEETNGSN